MTPILEAVVEQLHPQAETKEVRLLIECPTHLPSLAVNAEQLQQALRNLLENALHYTTAGGKITLQAEPQGQHLIVTVTDTGSGIAPEHLPHIFDRFYRVPGQPSASGTGLGLSIVRDIVTAHGGTVTCTSELGTGTSFRLELPLPAAQGGCA